MDKLAKAMKGLEACIKGDCRENACPCRKSLERDALELLKAHQPHVMTLPEAFDAEVAWLEMYADPNDGVEPIIQPVIIRYYENGYWECLIEQDESPALTLFIEDFNSEFRFWTARPTDEQRKAVKWE